MRVCATWKVPLILLLLSQWLANGNNTTHNFSLSLPLFCLTGIGFWKCAVINREASRHSSFLTHVVCTGQNRTDRSAGRTWLFDLCSDFLFFFYFFSVLFFFFFFYFTFAENHNSYLSYLVSWNVLFCGRAVAVAIVVGKPHALIYFSYILYICVWIYKTYRAEYMYV